MKLESFFCLQSHCFLLPEFLINRPETEGYTRQIESLIEVVSIKIITISFKITFSKFFLVVRKLISN